MSDVTAEQVNAVLRDAAERGWGPDVMIPILTKCMIPAAEAGNPVLDEMCGLYDESGAQTMTVDWPRCIDMLSELLAES